jgi:hypothetical protein
MGLLGAPDRHAVRLDIRSLDDPNLAKNDKPRYSGEKLTLNFQNVEVRSVLQVIADFTGLNIIASDTVSGNVTLRLKDVPWDQALDIIMRAKGLDKRSSGSVIWVAPRDELAAKEKQELEAKKSMADLEALTTRSYRLNYCAPMKRWLWSPAIPVRSMPTRKPPPVRQVRKASRPMSFPAAVPDQQYFRHRQQHQQGQPCAVRSWRCIA